MGIKNSKMSVNISNPRKRDDQKLEATEKGDTVEEIRGNVKADSIEALGESVGRIALGISVGKEEEAQSSEGAVEDQVEPPKDNSNGRLVSEPNGDEGAAGEEKKAPQLSKVASLKRELSVEKLQNVFTTKEEKQGSPQKTSEESATAAEGDIKREETNNGEDVESRVTSLKRSMMKMFTRDPETPTSNKVDKEEQEKINEPESPEGIVSSLKKRLSFRSTKNKHLVKENTEAEAAKAEDVETIENVNGEKGEKEETKNGENDASVLSTQDEEALIDQTASPTNATNQTASPTNATSPTTAASPIATSPAMATSPTTAASPTTTMSPTTALSQETAMSPTSAFDPKMFASPPTTANQSATVTSPTSVQSPSTTMTSPTTATSPTAIAPHLTTPTTSAASPSGTNTPPTSGMSGAMKRGLNVLMSPLGFKASLNVSEKESPKPATDVAGEEHLGFIDTEPENESPHKLEKLRDGEAGFSELEISRTESDQE